MLSSCVIIERCFKLGQDSIGAFTVVWRGRRVTVKHVAPGCTDPGNCDYWYSQEHDRRFFTFIDRYPEGCSPIAANNATGLPQVSLCTRYVHSALLNDFK